MGSPYPEMASGCVGSCVGADYMAPSDLSSDRTGHDEVADRRKPVIGFGI